MLNVRNTRVFAALAAVGLSLAIAVASPASAAAPEASIATKVTVTYKTYTVKRVVDGDTLLLTNGARVRIIGIDTPEKGECGFTKSKAALVKLIQGKKVKLGNPSSVKNADHYGRWLRTVVYEGKDVGLGEIKSGLANARYDSRDGYQYHPGEKAYRAMDAKVHHKCGAKMDRKGE